MSDMRTRATQDQHTSTDDRHGSGRLIGKVAIVTGGDAGIGRATAVLFAREGADVTIVYLPAAQRDAEATAALVGSEGQGCELAPGDLKEHGFCNKVVADTLERYGRLDILVNNPASQDFQTDVAGIDREDADRKLRATIHGYFQMARAAVPHLAQGGAIINVGLMAEFDGGRQLLDYSATKGAIHAFTKSLARNLVSEGIRVNAVVPGPVWTPRATAAPADPVAVFGQDTPMKRPAQPEEIAPAIVFLASSSDASYISGEVLSLLGAETTAA
jgi:NAD(P)-dependent dehydrogenase (short-subunit alcohol dehydrogenase family)